jgi:hypothetical protein
MRGTGRRDEFIAHANEIVAGHEEEDKVDEEEREFAGLSSMVNLNFAQPKRQLCVYGRV